LGREDGVERAKRTIVMKEIKESMRAARAAFDAGETAEATLHLLKARFAIQSARRGRVKRSDAVDRDAPSRALASRKRTSED
jgi:hypothetical protein